MPQSPQELPLQEFPELLEKLQQQHQSRISKSMSGATASKPRIYVAGSSGEPTAMLDTLRHEPAAAHNLHFPLPGLNMMDFTALSDTTEHSVFFMSAALKNAAAERLHYVPIHMRRVYDHLLECPVDIALLQVALDRNGEMRVAANADFAGAAVANPNTTVVACLNEGFVAPLGAPIAPKIDYLVTGANEIPEFASAPVQGSVQAGRANTVEQAIGAHVASLINDGDTLQTGIGAIPAAVLAELSQKTDLGFHGGLIDDAVFALIEAGVITGARKNIDRGQHVTGIVLGSAALLEKLADAPDVLLLGANRTHESSVISKLDNFVSINSAVQVDLFGQVNGEYAAGRQLSGTGGSVDFMRSARGSRGGRSIVALPATAKGGSISRIVPRVDMVTALRTDVDIVVTEFGVAHLRDQPLGERVGRLAAIAAPEFRSELLAAG